MVQHHIIWIDFIANNNTLILGNIEVQTERSSSEKLHIDDKAEIDEESNLANTHSTEEQQTQDTIEEKPDMDSTQRLMERFWKPRKSLSHRLKGLF